ncbi:helix-turn-helix domain-containing protein [Glycomyces paridis]|uniref:Helix-turn-helix domain-containing protein n=1 Tax=Glycomyces paridis TaxID=2126555 RepID=A0A4S8P6V9_9ACTN|nr:helix-turn-helix domain-containing protein [Glycomyces paridis]THV26000.1 helix-turn-helix domain-containing protein [Glycomyces paridis]
MPSRIPPEEREAIAEAIRSGRPRNEIAREYKRSAGTISNIAAEFGLTDAFDRSATENATKAKQADNRSMRAELSRRLLVKAGELLDQVDDPHIVFNFGGKDNTFEQRTLPRPPTGDIRNLIVSAATAIDKHIVIDRHDSGAGLDETVGLLDRIMTGLKEKHGDGGDAHPRAAD